MGLLPERVERVLTRDLHERSSRALERQLEYQTAKARSLALAGESRLRELEVGLLAHAERVRRSIARHRAIAPSDRVLEVGSGAHGLIFFLGHPNAVGVDPLAEAYRTLFPRWQGRARTINASGESLPFADSSFDVVLSDNVVDHAERPDLIVREMSRVLAPGGLLYFTVHVHHPIYSVASDVHGVLRAIGASIEVRPFADHTFHLTEERALGMFERLPLRIVHTQVERAPAINRLAAVNLLKRRWFKNADLELVAIRT